MRRVLPAFLSLALLLTMAAQPAAADEPRILLVGDSWAWFMHINGSFERAFNARGIEGIGVEGSFTTVPGSTSEQWTQEAWLAQITKALDAFPTLDIVHISLGGNDFLRGWTPDMPVEERTALFQGVVDDLEIIVTLIHKVRPDIQVAIINYDYINATRGGSTLQQLNRAGQILAGMKRDLAMRLPNTDYIQNYGLMQYHFGIDDLPPKSVPYPGNAPDYDPWPGGDADYGNPATAMMDNIHLSVRGYRLLAEHCLDVRYNEWLGLDETAVAQAAGVE